MKEVRILVVDDDEELRKGIIRNLSDQHEDWKFQESWNGHQANSFIRREEQQNKLYDAIICDLQMSAGDGWDVLAYCSHNLIETPIIMHTSASEKIVQLQEAGAHDVVIKGYDGMERLDKAITRILNKD